MQRMRWKVVAKASIAFVLGTFMPLGLAFAQASDDANKSNNPLSLAPSLNFQNYYTPRLFGTSAHTNDFLVRPTLPIGPGSFLGVPQILRGTVPFGLGAGKAWRAGKNIFNVFVEPQWTVAHRGEGLRQFTVFLGMNMTFRAIAVRRTAPGQDPFA